MAPIIAAALAMLLSGCVRHSVSDGFVEVRREGGFVIYTPDFSRIDLVTGAMPPKKDSGVIFCCEAAFTGKKQAEFSHGNIAGHHVSGGEFFPGFKCGTNNGVFTWDRKSGWRFYNYAHRNSKAVLLQTASRGGMGFGQNLIIHNGKEFTGCFKPGTVDRYRALCSLDGGLCVIDCASRMRYADFKKGLLSLGVKDAMYLDMGLGWSYSWYRKPDGKVKEIHHVKGKYCTNWITFYAQ